ncbi:hypothetical protein C8F04DRAFT_642495 [Mycena alexandri]|uniref:Secreted protein n=1 Tax=Mycena alexandri TaxID=1745969 RepID=A0AAD6XDS3_9AGAR|nr:hypothetical protein C8F04DRAFT_642495 [Mycena alexandri]
MRIMCVRWIRTSQSFFFASWGCASGVCVPECGRGPPTSNISAARRCGVSAALMMPVVYVGDVDRVVLLPAPCGYLLMCPRGRCGGYRDSRVTVPRPQRHRGHPSATVPARGWFAISRLRVPFIRPPSLLNLYLSNFYPPTSTTCVICSPPIIITRHPITSIHPCNLTTQYTHRAYTLHLPLGRTHKTYLPYRIRRSVL